MNTGRIPVLMYHRIGAIRNAWEAKYCISPQTFSGHMKALADSGYRAVSLEDFFAALDGAKMLPPRGFLLTFDDGFLGLHEHALPLLVDLEFPATVFLVSALIGKQDEWCRNSNPGHFTYPLLDTAHIAEMRRRGFMFQSHTRHHADLTTLDNAQLKDELTGSKAELEFLLGEPVDYLAYPFGRHDDRVVVASRAAGYRACFSVQPGFNRPDVDRFRIRRLDVFGTDTPAMLMRKVKFGSNDGSLTHAARYYLSRLKNRLPKAS